MSIIFFLNTSLCRQACGCHKQEGDFNWKQHDRTLTSRLNQGQLTDLINQFGFLELELGTRSPADSEGDVTICGAMLDVES
jgi:hypothetical protein